MCQYLLSGGDCPISSLQFNLAEELFYLARISFVLNARRRPSNNPIQYGDLFIVVGAGSKSSAHCQFILALHHPFEPVERGARA